MFPQLNDFVKFDGYASSRVVIAWAAKPLSIKRRAVRGCSATKERLPVYPGSLSSLEIYRRSFL
jgi:hypothetical protein